jgi:hypothetical protein
MESTDAQSYLGAYFVLSQLLLLFLVYLFTKVDWRAVFREKKFRWVKASSAVELGTVKAGIPK